VFKLVGKEVESRAVVELDLSPTSRVHGDSPRLVQVILNLVMNAMHALPASETATNRIWIRLAEERANVVIEVADNGPGVPPEMRERIFEPFQTTKEVGDGSGLGLFVCRNIVRSWSGNVSVAARAGGGARFRIELPAVREVVTPAPATRTVAADHSASILIIDDEPLVAETLGRLLKRAGHRVTVETSSQRAIELLTRDDQEYDLVYCDLMMKGTSGMDVAAALSMSAPSRLERVVFMTGGAFTDAARNFRAVHDEQCVDKPFNILAETARRLAAWS
jgi:CheY-like chemotaxis protein/anti-sigma regulatory factor (Ser/Thr protein kinase)